jgi:2-hydroxychromene-2-carboxylate isomerase
MNVDFWFEFGSTYSYPAAMRIEALAAERGVTVSWRAFLLGPIFAEQGWNDSPFNLYPSKGRYMWRDIERVCEAQGISIRRPSEFPRNGLLAARVACRFSEAPWLPGFVRAVYRANFAEDVDISSPATVTRCLASSGKDPATILKEAQSRESKARLRAQTDEAARLGIFGAPSFLVGRELFWGNDRLEDALSWAVEHAAQPHVR